MLSIVVVNCWILWTRQIYHRYVTGSSGYDSHNYMIALPPEKMLRARSTTTYTANRGNVHSQRASARSPRPASTEHAHHSRRSTKGLRSAPARLNAVRRYTARRSIFPKMIEGKTRVAYLRCAPPKKKPLIPSRKTKGEHVPQADSLPTRGAAARRPSANHRPERRIGLAP